MTRAWPAFWNALTASFVPAYSFHMTGSNVHFAILLQPLAGRVLSFNFPDRSAA